MTTHKARDYQAAMIEQTFDEWARGARAVLNVLPTGGGKSFVAAATTNRSNMPACVMAHRGELVGQLSIALAREGVRHRIIGPPALQRHCAQLHVEELGVSYIDPNHRIAVASVDTIIGLDPATPWLHQVGLWVQDEAHHVLADNKWGRACALFPNARGLGYTATPVRADGKGLGRHADGLFEAMVVGPTMRELIRRGFLTDYRVFAPPSDIDLSTVTTTDSGDYSPPKLKAARRASHITGDVVQHYLRIARGKLGVTFDTDIESATETAAAFQAAGVPAEVVHSKTPEALRRHVLRRFRQREVLQLVNVDLFGEGFDLPAIEVVSMARPTQSYSLFAQQFGRALRPLDGKDRAIIIDHVGNVMRHGLPDAPRTWTLDRRERSSRSSPNDAVPVRTCLNPECMSVYERIEPACPFCGKAPEIADRSRPKFVDGDLHELDPAVLARLRGDIAAVDGAPRIPHGAGPEVAGAIKRRHWERQQSQAELRQTIALWTGWQTEALGRSESESFKRFFWTYGVDVATTLTFGSADAENLRLRIQAELDRNNVVRKHEV